MEREVLQMTDEEFEVLDELYFVQSFRQLEKLVDLAPETLVKTLQSLFDKGWIKVMIGVDEELPENQVNLQSAGTDYFFLASKKGLLAHNS